MKTSSPPVAPDRASARACTLTNLLVLPGLGSLVAGRRVGWAQAALALAGLGLFLYGVARLLRDWLAAGAEPVFEFTPALGCLLGGLAVSVVAWLWALVTSLQIHREVRAREREATAAATGSPAIPAAGTHAAENTGKPGS